MDQEISKICQHWKAQLPENWVFTLTHLRKDTTLVTWSYPTQDHPISRTTLKVTFTASTFSVEFDKSVYALARAFEYEVVDFESFVRAKESQMRDLEDVLMVKTRSSRELSQLEGFTVEEDENLARINADKALINPVAMTKERAFKLLEAL